MKLYYLSRRRDGFFWKKCQRIWYMGGGPEGAACKSITAASLHLSQSLSANTKPFGHFLKWIRTQFSEIRRWLQLHILRICTKWHKFTHLASGALEKRTQFAFRHGLTQQLQTMKWGVGVVVVVVVVSNSTNEKIPPKNVITQNESLFLSNPTRLTPVGERREDQKRLLERFNSRKPPNCV